MVCTPETLPQGHAYDSPAYQSRVVALTLQLMLCSYSDAATLGFCGLDRC